MIELSESNALIFMIEIFFVGCLAGIGFGLYWGIINGAKIRKGK